MSPLSFVFYLILTFIFVPTSVFLTVSSLVERKENEELLLFSLSLGLALPLLSFVLYFSMLLFPYQSDDLYISLVIFIFSIPYLGLRKGKRAIVPLLKSIRKIFHSRERGEILILLFACFFLLMLALLSIFSPVTANDPLQYFTMSKYIYLEKNPLIYPFIEPYKNGYYSITAHPPTYHMLLVWSYLFQDSNLSTLAGRLLAPWFTFVTALLMLCVFSLKTRRIGAFSVLIFIMTPLLFRNSALAHIDALRVATFFTATASLMFFVERTNKTRAVFFGIASGFAMRAHCSGILALFFLGGSLLLIYRKELHVKFPLLLLAAGAAFVVCGFDYGRNFYLFGRVIPGTEEFLPVYHLGGINYVEYIKLTRDLFNPLSLFVNGILKGFVQLYSFGLSYWFMLIGMGIAFLSKYKFKYDIIFIHQIIFFYLIVIISILLGKIIVVKNPRYYMLVHPFVCYWGALFIEECYAKTCEK